MSKKNTPAVRPATSDKEADLLIAAIGAESREIVMIQTALSEDIAKIKVEYEAKAAPIAARIEEATEAVRLYCEANRKRLCPKELKTYRFPSGDISWRAKPKSVKVRGKAERVIDWLRQHGPAKFLREKPELNKEAMLEDIAEAEKVPGITIKSGGEDFSISPFDAKLSQEVA
ncbi:MAG TPA: host-nuclease inhibitor Gam family protein [Candidatus Binataceae bacterium]|nr:host-nuclease inhibitor Gam family protein [Candidatus Binataceae bacterium]